MSDYFVRAIEIWVPGSSSSTLELGSSYYGDLDDFRDASAGMSFAFDQGLPGKTWARGRPVVLTNLDNSYFQRGAAAARAGIYCGVSIPIYCGEFLLAVAVLFCGGGPEAVGAMEVWENVEGSEHELKLADGYYGDLERFEWISRRLSIMRGHGLPGGAWASGRPLIMTDLADSSAFLRARSAAEVGITTGLAIPYLRDNGDVQILTLLSARGSPIAGRFEIWTRDPASSVLRFDSGFCAEGADLAAERGESAIIKGQGPLGTAWLTGRPLVTQEGGQVMLVLPVIRRAGVASLMCLIL